MQPVTGFQVSSVHSIVDGMAQVKCLKLACMFWHSGEHVKLCLKKVVVSQFDARLTNQPISHHLLVSPAGEVTGNSYCVTGRPKLE